MIIDYLNGKGEETNCHGCKWLDNVNNKGEGYCCQVVRSQTYKSGDKVRHQKSKRCELYEEGNFTTRYREGT